MKIHSLLVLAWIASLAPLPWSQRERPLGPPLGQECFEGSGGPNGDFDWVVHQGELFFFDTTLTLVQGGPGGVPMTVQTCVNGVIDVRHLTIEPGGQVRVQGPNPMLIRATGDVVIRGVLDISGFRAHDVATLNTGNQVEMGGAGSAGAGRGGHANLNTMGSTARGGSGQGPFGELDTGGEGGESGYAPAMLGKNARRPGGGGGGRFAADVPEGTSPTPSMCSLIASAGTDGNPEGRGALSGMPPPSGGQPGAGPFMDGDPRNDFFGIRPVARGGGLVELIQGELPSLWAGYGGGGGGNAIPSDAFPNPNWNFASDEKGGGGGGGGGALHVQALGQIVFGALGTIRSNGAFGGTGENTLFLDHVGGTGGGASGGHVVLESLSGVDFTDGGANTGALPRDWLSACGPQRRPGPLQDVDACCRAMSNGGAGGGGVIQLHVPDPLALPGTDPGETDILVPDPVSIVRNPLDALASPAALTLLPTFVDCPAARAGWIPARQGYLRLKALLEDLTGQRSAVSPAPGIPDPLASDLEALVLPMRF